MLIHVASRSTGRARAVYGLWPTKGGRVHKEIVPVVVCCLVVLCLMLFIVLVVV